MGLILRCGAHFGQLRAHRVIVVRVGERKIGFRHHPLIVHHRQPRPWPESLTGIDRDAAVPSEHLHLMPAGSDTRVADYNPMAFRSTGGTPPRRDISNPVRCASARSEKKPARMRSAPAFIRNECDYGFKPPTSSCETLPPRVSVHEKSSFFFAGSQTLVS